MFGKADTPEEQEKFLKRMPQQAPRVQQNNFKNIRKKNKRILVGIDAMLRSFTKNFSKMVHLFSSVSFNH